MKYPNNINKKRSLIGINGDRRFFTITDEIRFVPPSNREKVIYLQKLEFKDSSQTELRFGYYMLGKKPGRMKGRWIWGQYALQIHARDLRIILKKAKAKDWL